MAETTIQPLNSPQQTMRNFGVGNIRHERLRVMDYFFILFMFVIHFEYVFVRLGLEDTIFKPYRLLAGFCALAYLPRLGAVYKRIPELANPLIVMFLYACFVTVLRTESSKQIVALLQIPVTSLAILLSGMAASNTKAVRLAMYAFCFGVILNIGYGSLTILTEYRLSGFYKNPNHLGAAIATTLIILIYQFPKRIKALRPAVLIGLFGALALTGSRGAILACVLAILFISATQSKTRVRLVVVAIVGMFVLGMFYEPILDTFNGLSGGRLSQRFSADELTRASGRFAITKSAMAVGWESSFLGIGIGRYQLFHMDMLAKLGLVDAYGIALGTHNFYISLLVEWGMVSFVAFCVFVYLAYWSRLSQARSFIIGVLFMYGVFGVTTDLVFVIAPWAMLGLFLRMEAMTRSTPKRDTFVGGN